MQDNKELRITNDESRNLDRLLNLLDSYPPTKKNEVADFMLTTIELYKKVIQMIDLQQEIDVNDLYDILEENGYKHTQDNLTLEIKWMFKNKMVSSDI